jgi:superfamily I DNA/RNA helicase
VTLALTPEHRLAVEAPGHIICSAAPGSGKTRVIISRAQRLLAQSPANFITIATFTKEAALEIRQRLVNLVGKEDIKRVREGTFHSLCLEQLGPGLPLIDEVRRLEYLSAAMRRSGFSVASLAEASRVVDARRMSPIGERDKDAAGVIAREYQNMLQSVGVRDFTGLLLDSVRGMHAGSLKPLPATHLMVDELQDIDELQRQWIMFHAAAGQNIFGAGDDDQAIYRFRASLGYAGMQMLAANLPARIVALTRNFRSHSEILTPADTLIRRNTSRYPKPLQSHKGPGGFVEFTRFKDEESEVAAVIEAARTQSEKHSLCILTRTRFPLLALAMALAAKKIPFTSSLPALWEKRVVQHFLTLLRIVAGIKKEHAPLDATLLYLGLQDDDHATLMGLTRDPLTGLIKDAPKSMSVGARELLGALDGVIGEARAMLSAEPSNIHAITTKLGAFLDKRVVNQEDARLITAACDVFAKYTSGSLTTRLYSIASTSRDRHTSDRLNLGTMHSAKGREFDRVWLLRCNADVIPAKDSDLAEERRLFYVAMTRPRQRLTISSVGIPSPFLLEAFPLNVKAINAGGFHIGRQRILT